MSSPSVGASVSSGLRAAAREGWLVPVAWLSGLVRTWTILPPIAVAALLLAEGAGLAAQAQPFRPLAPLAAMAAVASSPRVLALVGGLALAGALLGVLVRAIFLAGALPTLATGPTAGGPGAFAGGAVGGGARVLGVLVLAGLAEAVAFGLLACLAWGSARALRAEPGPALSAALAVTGALGAALSLVFVVAVRLLADLGAARAAVLEEGPAAALAGALRRVAEQPGPLLLAAFLAVVASLAVPAGVQALGGLVPGGLAGAPGALRGGLQLFLGVVVSLAGAAVDVGWLSVAAVLGCAEGAPPGAGGRLSA